MTKKTTLWAFATVFLLTAAIIAYVLWDEARISKRLTTQTEAVGFTATPVKWRDHDDREISGHTLTFAYIAGEKVHTRTIEKITWYHPEKQYHVCYNPADSEDSKLYPTDHVCGQ